MLIWKAWTGLWGGVLARGAIVAVGLGDWRESNCILPGSACSSSVVSSPSLGEEDSVPEDEGAELLELVDTLTVICSSHDAIPGGGL